MKRLLMFFFAILLTTSIFAQREGRERNKEEYRALKVAYITDRLAFTPEESQNFWPIQNQFEQKLETLKGSAKRLDNEEMTDAEAQTFIEDRLAKEQEMLDLKKAYIKDLEDVLPPQKIAMLFVIEHEFKRRMLRTIREKRQDKRH